MVAGTLKRTQNLRSATAVVGIETGVALSVRGCEIGLNYSRGGIRKSCPGSQSGQIQRGTGVQTNSRSGRHIERLFAAGLGNAHMLAGACLQRFTNTLPFVP